MKPIQITIMSLSLPQPCLFTHHDYSLSSPYHLSTSSSTPSFTQCMSENIILTQGSLVTPLQSRLSGVATSKDCKHVNCVNLVFLNQRMTWNTTPSILTKNKFQLFCSILNELILWYMYSFIISFFFYLR